MRRLLHELVSAWYLLTRTLTNGWPSTRLERQLCWHHDRTTGDSWVTSTLIDTGRTKMFRCRSCEATWFLGEFLRTGGMQRGERIRRGKQ